MSEGVIVALITLIGSLAGTFGGIWVTNKLVVYRIDKLEEGLKSVSGYQESIHKLEIKSEVVETRLTDLEDETKRIITDIRDIKKGVGINGA